MREVPEIAAEAADDIRTLLEIVCIGDSKQVAEEYKALFANLLVELDQLAAD